jgi:threonine/homoserine efflux transporter RhtA
MNSVFDLALRTIPLGIAVALEIHWPFKRRSQVIDSKRRDVRVVD